MKPCRTVLETTAAIASGDAEAFSSFYEVWFDRVVAEVMRMTGRDESFALDIAQEVMVAVIHRMKPLDSEAALAAWLRRAALRRALTHLRAERRRAERERAASPSRRTAPAVDGSTDEAIRWVRLAMQSEDRVAARLIEARFRFGWTLARAGAAVGISGSAADGRVGRSLARLRAVAIREQRRPATQATTGARDD